jgi:hypothetical protein
MKNVSYRILIAVGEWALDQAQSGKYSEEYKDACTELAEIILKVVKFH